MMTSNYAIIKKLPGTFSHLMASLLAWREVGRGLWPIAHCSEQELLGVLTSLYQFTFRQLSASVARPVPLPHWNCNCGEVQSGPDLVMLIEFILTANRPPFSAPIHRYDSAAADMIEVLETLLFCVIGLVYAEEPGELTVEDFVTDF
jgi:hypothetical protein